MNYTNLLSDKTTSHTNEVYIEYLSKNIGVSREEIIEVIKISCISARRIAEYILNKERVFSSEKYGGQFEFEVIDAVLII